MIKLSKAGKMPCPSWSLPALITCPGSISSEGEVVDACLNCYALKGTYNFPAVIKVRDHNLKDWGRDEWVGDMVRAIRNLPYFRFFDSGDIHSEWLAYRIFQICTHCPNTKFWIPTRSYKDPKINYWLRLVRQLPNVVVRLSSDSIHGETLNRKGYKNSSTIFQHENQFDKKKGNIICRANERNGKCDKCRACWSKDVKTVYYKLH